MGLIKLVRIRIVLSTRYFPFLAGHGKDSERNDRFRPFSEAFFQRAWKKLECLVLRVVPDEEFMHTKINNEDAFVYYDATEDVPEYGHAV